MKKHPSSPRPSSSNDTVPDEDAATSDSTDSSKEIVMTRQDSVPFNRKKLQNNKEPEKEPSLSSSKQSVIKKLQGGQLSGTVFEEISQRYRLERHNLMEEVSDKEVDANDLKAIKASLWSTLYEIYNEDKNKNADNACENISPGGTHRTPGILRRRRPLAGSNSKTVRWSANIPDSSRNISRKILQDAAELKEELRNAKKS